MPPKAQHYGTMALCPLKLSIALIMPTLRVRLPKMQQRRRRLPLMQQRRRRLTTRQPGRRSSHPLTPQPMRTMIMMPLLASSHGGHNRVALGLGPHRTSLYLTLPQPGPGLMRPGCSCEAQMTHVVATCNRILLNNCGTMALWHHQFSYNASTESSPCVGTLEM